MSELIVCPKDSGNTFKIAQYLKENTGADLLILEGNGTADLSRFEDIYLLTGIYAGKIHKNLSRWLKELDEDDLSYKPAFHVFLTWLGRGSSDQTAFDEIQAILNEKGTSCDPDFDSCFGGMAFIRKGHPDDRDLNKALGWMKKA